MNFKQRFALYFSILFTIILGVVLFVLLSLFVKFRRDEFKRRLEEKAISSISLLVDLPDMDKQILRNYDRKQINRLYNEKTLLFNQDMELIYSSINDSVVRWKLSDLQYLKKHKELFRKEGGYEVIGIYARSKGNSYYAIVGAEDKYGNRQLQFLEYSLYIAFLLGIIAVSFLSYYVSKRSFSVLDQLKVSILEINDQKLDYRLEVGDRNDEINALSNAFNLMMERLQAAYLKQKEFIYNASHELRTPVARIVMQLQNVISNEKHSDTTHRYLKSLLEDANQMTDIISSLLLLSKIEEFDNYNYLPLCRVDEVIFDAIEASNKSFPDFHIRFNIENKTSNDDSFDVKGDFSLLKIVFLNLLKNAYLYSANKQVEIFVIQNETDLRIEFVNEGNTISETDQPNIFKAFSRGDNSRQTDGTGLGLRIVERILYYHKAEIIYDIPSKNVNRFSVIFKL